MYSPDANGNGGDDTLGAIYLTASTDDMIPSRLAFVDSISGAVYIDARPTYPITVTIDMQAKTPSTWVPTTSGSTELTSNSEFTVTINEPCTQHSIPSHSDPFDDVVIYLDDPAHVQSKALQNDHSSLTGDKATECSYYTYTFDNADVGHDSTGEWISFTDGSTSKTMTVDPGQVLTRVGTYSIEYNVCYTLYSSSCAPTQWISVEVKSPCPFMTAPSAVTATAFYVFDMSLDNPVG